MKNKKTIQKRRKAPQEGKNRKKQDNPKMDARCPIGRERINMDQQDELRRMVRVAKANNQEWNYRDMAYIIGITINAFYNWMNGQYRLSNKKKAELESLIDDLMC